MPPPRDEPGDSQFVSGPWGAVPARYVALCTDTGFNFKGLSINQEDGRRAYCCEHYPPHLEFINDPEQEDFAESDPCTRTELIMVAEAFESMMSQIVPDKREWF